MKKMCMLFAGLCLVAAFATGCGGSTSTEATTASATAAVTTTPSGDTGGISPTAAASAAQITVENFGFGEPLTVAPGATVNVTNNDSAEHSVTSDTTGVFDVDIEGNSGATFSAPTQPGEYSYSCRYHPSMKGVLIVQ